VVGVLGRAIAATDSGETLILEETRQLGLVFLRCEIDEEFPAMLGRRGWGDREGVVGVK